MSAYILRSNMASKTLKRAIALECKCDLSISRPFYGHLDGGAVDRAKKFLN